MDSQFDGQQSDEKILSVICPNIVTIYYSCVVICSAAIMLFIVVTLIGAAISSGFLWLVGLAFSLFIALFGIRWNKQKMDKNKTYFTDRRIIRFEMSSPFVRTKRALFWNEVLKAKGYSPNFFSRMIGIGIVEVEPHLAENENIIINNVSYYEDLANYIDKILFIFKNKPQEITDIKPFVAKPKGKRDIQ